MLGFFEFGTRVRPRHHVVRFLRHAAAHLAAELHDGLLRRLARHCLQRAGQHEGLPRHFRMSVNRRRSGPRDAAGEQPIDDGCIVGIVEISGDILRDHRTHVRNPLDLVLSGLAQRRHIAEIPRQRERGRLAHIAYAERVQKSRQRRALGTQNGGLQFLRGLIAHALERRELLLLQVEQIRGCSHPIAIHQLFDELVAQSLDVQGAARGKMLDFLLALRRAYSSSGAPRDRLIGLAHHRRSAHRAHAGQRHQRRARNPALGQHAHHFRNDIAGATNDHRIAHSDVLAGQFVHVVQGCIADGDAADEHRFEPRHRGQRARAAHLKFDVAHRGESLFGGEFVRDRPARRPRNESQLPLQIEIVDLVDHAVDLVRQLRAQRTHLTVVIQTAVGPFHDARLRADLESPMAQCLQYRAVMSGQVAALDDSEAVDEQVERTRRRHTRIELAQASRRRIARVDETLLAARNRFPVEAFETGQRHEYLAPDLEHRRRSSGAQFHGQRLDGLEVLRDVLAGFAVAARRALHVHAVLIPGADGQAVQFRLGRIANGFLEIKPFPDTAVEVAHLLVAEGVVQRQHGEPMPHRAESRNRRRAHPLRRRIRGQQLRMLNHRERDSGSCIGPADRAVPRPVLPPSSPDPLPSARTSPNQFPGSEA